MVGQPFELPHKSALSLSPFDEKRYNQRQMSESNWGKSRILLHGWDAAARAWHGPDELAFTLSGCRRILQKLRSLPGSWYGRLRGETPGLPLLNFAACIHDLGDAGLGILDLEGSPGGPLQVVLVIPAHLRASVRPEFAFEFVSFTRFLEGPQTLGTELEIHDYIQRVLEEPGDPATLIFSLETRTVLPEIHLLLAEQAERLAMSMIAWMGERAEHAAGSGKGGSSGGVHHSLCV
jgi:hypothetical protein